MKAVLHPGVEHDLEQAAAFYEREASPALAARFIAEYDRAIALLLAHSSAGTPSGDFRRTFPLAGFPYSIVYREMNYGIRILVIRHNRRRPNLGDRRR